MVMRRSQMQCADHFFFGTRRRGGVFPSVGEAKEPQAALPDPRADIEKYRHFQN